MENKNAICESDSVYEIIKKVLLEQDINSYEPEVIENLIDFADSEYAIGALSVIL